MCEAAAQGVQLLLGVLYLVVAADSLELEEVTLRIGLGEEGRLDWLVVSHGEVDDESSALSLVVTNVEVRKPGKTEGT